MLLKNNDSYLKDLYRTCNQYLSQFASRKGDYTWWNYYFAKLNHGILDGFPPKNIQYNFPGSTTVICLHLFSDANMNIFQWGNTLKTSGGLSIKVMAGCPSRLIVHWHISISVRVFQKPNNLSKQIPEPNFKKNWKLDGIWH